MLTSARDPQVRERNARGDESHCFASEILRLQKSYELSDNEMTFLAGAMYGAGESGARSYSSRGEPFADSTPLPTAGSDTTADGISTFFMTMVAHPEVQRKAQEELDRVIGQSRLPSFDDQDDLVYCQAIVREIMRWRTVVAGGLAHATTEDDFYEGESRRWVVAKALPAVSL